MTFGSDSETIVLNLRLFADPNDVMALARERIPTMVLP